MTDLEAFVCKILSPGGSLDDAGALADFLEEQGDPRGVLLRRRWKRWHVCRAAELARDDRERQSVRDGTHPWLSTYSRSDVLYHIEMFSFTRRVDLVFENYLFARFVVTADAWDVIHDAWTSLATKIASEIG